MNAILDRAKEIERKCSTESQLLIRLSFLQDLIAEIERLQQVEQMAGKSVALVRKAAEQRQEAQP